MKTAVALEETKVEWAGNPSPWAAPGLEGYVVKVADKDPNSIKVMWTNPPRGYTWERRKNLRMNG